MNQDLRIIVEEFRLENRIANEESKQIVKKGLRLRGDEIHKKRYICNRSCRTTDTNFWKLEICRSQNSGTYIWFKDFKNRFFVNATLCE